MEERVRARLERVVAGFRGREAAILDAALDCVIGMGPDGRVSAWNRAAERTFGYTAREARGRVLADLIVPPELRARHAAGLRRFLETGEQRIIGERVELVALRRDGSRFPVELTVTHFEEAGAAQFVAYVRDITLRKQAEEQLERSRDELAVILAGIVEGVIAQD